MPDQHADRIFYNGDILTMDAAGRVVEAIAIKDGRIVAVGLHDEVLATRGPRTVITNLQVRALMPGFIDPHSHVESVGQKLASANLSPAPIGPIRSMEDIKRELRAHIKREKIPLGEWVVGIGYDDTAIEECRHPDRDDLDEVSREHPIYLMHISFHLGALNSLGLQRLGISAATAEPSGGRIRRRPDSNEPTGVLEELALAMVLANGPKPAPQQTEERLLGALNHYATLGITTAQEAAVTSPELVAICQRLASDGRLPIDLVVYPIYPVARAIASQADVVGAQHGLNTEVAPMDNDPSESAGPAEPARAAPFRRPGHFRIGGVKLLTDGSIQGYTAFLGQPYHIQPPHKTADYRGYSWFEEQGALNNVVAQCFGMGWPVIAHANGDAAIQMVIDALRSASALHPANDRRTTIIHGQTIREDQLDAAKELRLILSFFPGHVYYWGDRHRDIFLGPERAARLNPMRSALERGITVTLHHDAPVTPPDMLTVVWAAVNRVTSSGKELGPEQRLSAIEALRAVTINAAYQIFEEDAKGSLEPGKLADLVLLSENPLAIDPIKIRDIEIVETIKGGLTVFERR